MIYRAKVDLQNSKQLIGYSPMHSPSNRKKSSILKQNKFSPKPSHRENKQNLEQKQIKTGRQKQQKYFRIPKQQVSSSTKKQKTPAKLQITLNDKSNNFEEFEKLDFLNIQTPKFKCLSNKIDDRCKTQHDKDRNEKYFSFGEEFRQNIGSRMQDKKQMNFNKRGRQDRKFGVDLSMRRQREREGPEQIQRWEGIQVLKQRNKNNQMQESGAIVKKRDKMDKSKHGWDKIEMKFSQIQKQMKQPKFKKDRDVFCFKK